MALLEPFIFQEGHPFQEQEPAGLLKIVLGNFWKGRHQSLFHY